MAYDAATQLGATFSPNRPFRYGDKEYSVETLKAIAANREEDVTESSVSPCVPSRRKTKNCLPRLCNVLAMDKYRHRFLLSKQPLSRDDMDAKKTGSATDLWKEVLEDYVDELFEVTLDVFRLGKHVLSCPVQLLELLINGACA